MNRLLKLFSYFYPLIRKIPSEHSGALEISVWQGHKTLNSANANYSYGSLQRILTFALSQVDFSGVGNVLLLGLGGGSVIPTLRATHGFQGPITAVDIDAAVIRIAQDEFGIGLG